MVTSTTIASSEPTVTVSTMAITPMVTDVTTPVTDPAAAAGVEPTLPQAIGSPVEWRDLPAHPNQRLDYAHTLATSLTDAPLCPVDALELLPAADGAMGTLYGGLAVHNIGDAVCEVRGVPVIELIADDGTVVQSTDPANDINDAPPVVLEPNSWAEASLGIIGSNVCGGNQSSQLRFHWNGQIATTPFAIGRPPDLESCEGLDPNGSGPGHLQPIDTEGAAFAPLFEPRPSDTYGIEITTLAATIDAPATVQAGTTLHFTIQLANLAGTAPIVLIAPFPCPIYTAALATTAIEELLNCTDGGIVVQPGEAARFDMELDVPADAPPGDQTLMWTSTEPTGLSATASIDITS